MESINVIGGELETITRVKYLGTSVEKERGMETGITERVGPGWRNWKKSSGVLCERRMPAKLKGTLYKTVI